MVTVTKELIRLFKFAARGVVGITARVRPRVRQTALGPIAGNAALGQHGAKTSIGRGAVAVTGGIKSCRPGVVGVVGHISLDPRAHPADDALLGRLLGVARQVKKFRDRHRGQDTQDYDHHDQLDERETKILFPVFHISLRDYVKHTLLNTRPDLL